MDTVAVHTTAAVGYFRSLFLEWHLPDLATCLHGWVWVDNSDWSRLHVPTQSPLQESGKQACSGSLSWSRPCLCCLWQQRLKQLSNGTDWEPRLFLSVLTPCYSEQGIHRHSSRFPFWWGFPQEYIYLGNVDSHLRVHIFVISILKM